MDAVLAVIFNEDKSGVLLIKRRDVPLWVLPGGGMERDESVEESLHREVDEETGLKVNIIRKAAEYTPVNSLTSFTHLFECQIQYGTPKTGSETQEIGFFKLNQLPSTLFYIHGDFIKDVLNGNFVQKKLTRVTYWALLKYFVMHPTQVIRFALSRLGFPINS